MTAKVQEFPAEDGKTVHVTAGFDPGIVTLDIIGPKGKVIASVNIDNQGGNTQSRGPAAELAYGILEADQTAWQMARDVAWEAVKRASQEHWEAVKEGALSGSPSS
jgi:hypothetical protein